MNCFAQSHSSLHPSVYLVSVFTQIHPWKDSNKNFIPLKNIRSYLVWLVISLSPASIRATQLQPSRRGRRSGPAARCHRRPFAKRCSLLLFGAGLFPSPGLVTKYAQLELIISKVLALRDQTYHQSMFVVVAFYFGSVALVSCFSLASCFDSFILIASFSYF